MRGFSRLVVIGFTAVTVVIAGALGVSAAGGKADTKNAVNSVAAVVASVVTNATVGKSETKGAPEVKSKGDKDPEGGKDDNNGHCKGKHKGQSTPPHNNKPCKDPD